MTNKNNIPTYVQTGGPGSGKTSIMSFHKSKFVDKGYMVYVVPEAATILINEGLDRYDPHFQKAAMSLIINLEDTAKREALRLKKNGEKPLIICDRGVLDGKAYCSEDDFHKAMKSVGIKREQELFERYNGISFLRTAALGAEEYYLLALANNDARTESPENARLADSRTEKAWLGPLPYHFVDNSTDFEEKKERAHRDLCHMLGIPIPLEIEYKFLINENFNEDQIPVAKRTLDIVQHYLLGSKKNWEERVRKKGWDNYFTYYHTIKQPGPDGISRFETEEIIPYRRYLALLEKQNPDFQPIKKKRTCFIYENQYFEFDRMISPNPMLRYLELEVTDVAHKPNIPSWMPRIKEVTGDPSHLNRELARR